MNEQPLPMTSGDWSWLLQALQPPPAPDVPTPPPRPPLLGQDATAQPHAAAGPAPMAYSPAAPPPAPAPAPVPAAPAPVPTPTPRPPNVAGEFGNLSPPAANPDPSQSMQARQMIVNLVNRGLISPDQLASVFGRMQ